MFFLHLVCFRRKFVFVLYRKWWIALSHARTLFILYNRTWNKAKNPECSIKTPIEFLLLFDVIMFLCIHISLFLCANIEIFLEIRKYLLQNLVDLIIFINFALENKGFYR